MRTILLLSLLAVPLVPVLAGEKTAAEKSNADLIKELGHLDYDVREAATKALIARGKSAIADLEKALESEDVEVRMRAGRALRTIRTATPPRAEPKSEKPQENAAKPRNPIRPTARNQSVSVQMTSDGVVVTVKKRGEDGKVTSQTYKGKSLDEIKEKHPEAREALGGMNMRFGAMRDPFKDFDKLFEEGWGQPRDKNFWKDADAEFNREIERLRAWARRLADQQRQHAMGRMQGRRAEVEGLRLGIRARRPEAVLDAQLQLRGRGLVVEELVRDSVAAKLGLARFDILLELNGAPVRGHADIGPALRGRADDHPLTAKVLRRGKLVDLELKSAR